MGGFDSTRWNRVSTKDTVERYHSIDINRLNREGCLQPRYRGSWQWMRDGERVAWIELRREDDRLHLSYRAGPQGGDGRAVEQSTSIVWTPCRFGGTRPYFICPGMANGIACSRRVTKLYGAARYFLCWLPEELWNGTRKPRLQAAEEPGHSRLSGPGPEVGREGEPVLDRRQDGLQLKMADFLALDASDACPLIKRHTRACARGRPISKVASDASRRWP